MMETRSHAQVKAAPSPSFAPVRGGLLQRKCACSRSAGVAGKCEEFGKQGLSLQRSTRDSEIETRKSGGVPPIVHETLRSSGQPLAAETRAFMEPRFGHDFSKVRVHDDTSAAQSAQSMNARAYTVNLDIVFGIGEYVPNSHSGRRLLSHELTHVVQQRAGIDAQGSVGHEGDGYEQQADEVSARVAQGGSADLLPSHGATDLSPLSPTVVQFQKGDPSNKGGAGLDPTSNPAAGAMERAKLRAERGSEPNIRVYLCSKALERAPVGTHVFFRVGGASSGNPTYSLLPEDRGGNCWQGQPKKDFSSDVNASAGCISTQINLSCLENQFARYPIGHYCTLGPNSNTFAGSVARNCGMTDPDPPGWNPGIDDNPPPTGTFAGSPDSTAWGCTTKSCGENANIKPALGAVSTYGVTPVPRK